LIEKAFYKLDVLEMHWQHMT